MAKNNLAILGSLLMLLLPAMAAAEAESTLPQYERVSGISGNLSSVGSDMLANLVTLWAEQFQREYPSVRVQIRAAGSSTAPLALTEGMASLGPMSRKMKDREEAAFEAKYGYKPVAIRVAIDALAVFVHKDNPLQSLTIPQIDAVFSATRKCGYPEAIIRWQQLGLDLGKIQLYGRNSVSGTYGYLKERVLCKGDFKNNVNEQPGSASVVQSVSRSLNGMGYSGIGYNTSGVKALAIASQAGELAIEATKSNAITGEYPLSRYLYLYVNKEPNKPLSPVIHEFIKMILSQSGQQIVMKEGYIPLPASVVKTELDKLL